MRNIHIGFGDSATGCILEAIKNHNLPGDGAIPSRDDFTQGPISESTRDLTQRINYWESLNRVLGFKFEAQDFYNESIKIIDDLEAAEVTIWIGDSCHDILATGWLLSYLADKNFEWHIVNLALVNDEDLINGGSAVNLAMYSPSDTVKLYQYKRPLDQIGKTNFISTWEKAAQENSYYRIQEGNKIRSVEEDYFDQYILSFIANEFETASKVIGNILRDGQHRISDTTVEWNIRKMIDKGLVEFEGDLTKMNAYVIKKKMQQ